MFSLTYQGFAMLLNFSGCIVSASTQAYNTLWGGVNFSTASSSCLYTEDTLGDFSEVF